MRFRIFTSGVKSKWPGVLILFVGSVLAGLPFAGSAGAQSPDSDSDGVSDAADRCPFTTNLNGPIPTMSLCSDCMGDDQTLEGCNASDILACKPGDDLDEIKHGVTLGTQRVFSARRGWAGECGAASEIVTEGEDLVLQISGATFHAPDGALPPGLPLTLARIPLEQATSLPDRPDEEIVTDLFQLGVPEALPADAPLRLDIEVPNSVRDGFYALLQVEGGLQVEQKVDFDWRLEVGAFDPDAGVLTVTLFALASRISVVLVRRTDEPVSLAASAFSLVASASSLTDSSLEAKAADGGGTCQRESPFASHGWAVLCNPSILSEEACRVLPGLFARNLVEEDEILTALGFPRGVLCGTKLVNLQRLRSVFFDTFGDERSLVTAGGDVNEAEFFLAELQPATYPDPGLYGPTTGKLELRVDEGHETILHELMHAAQYAEIPKAWDRNWIIEGTATAVEPFAIGSTLPRGKEFRWDVDFPRDWGSPLNSDEDLEAYEVGEFWHSIDGALAYLPEAFEELRMHGTITPENEYEDVSRALRLAGVPSIADAYVDLILERDADPDYPYCDDQGFECSLGAGACDTSLPVAAIGAKCLVLDEVNFEPECPTGKPPLMATMTPPPGDPANFRMIVNGAAYAPGESTSVSEGDRVWLVNLETQPVSSRVLGFEIERESCCGDEFIEGDEECDDGNLLDGDGCSAECRSETEPLANPRTVLTVICNDVPADSRVFEQFNDTVGAGGEEVNCNALELRSGGASSIKGTARALSQYRDTDGSGSLFASASRDDEPTPVVIGGGGSRALAGLHYEFKVVPTVPLVDIPSSFGGIVPVRTEGNGSTFAESGASAVAGVKILGASGPPLAFDQSLSRPPICVGDSEFDELDTVLSYDISLNGVHRVVLIAQCGAGSDGCSFTGVPSPDLTECSAQVDGASFELDQATFDDRLGPDTFPLANFFAFEFSPVP